jgi:hypothetical protein
MKITMMTFKEANILFIPFGKRCSFFILNSSQVVETASETWKARKRVLFYIGFRFVIQDLPFGEKQAIKSRSNNT